MWELLTRGCTPYPGIDNYYIRDYLSTGTRMDRPSICPPIIYDLMCQCWKEDPDDRLSFIEISQFIEKLLKANTTIVSAKPDGDGAYSYARQATRQVTDDYLMRKEATEDDDYIVVLPTPAPRSVGNPCTVYVYNAECVEDFRELDESAL